MLRLIDRLNGSTALSRIVRDEPDGGGGPAAGATGGTGGAPADKSGGATGPKATTGGSERPEWLPESHWDPKAKAPKADQLKTDFEELPALRELKAKADERTAKVPKEAKDYKIELSDDLRAQLELPEDYELPFKTDDAVAAAARETAHELGWTQEEFNRVMALRIQLDRAETDYLATRAREEREKLGENHAERTAALTKKMEAQIGPEKAQALMTGAFDAVQIEALEDYAKLAGERSLGPFNHEGRNDGTKKLSQEEWDKLSPTEKMNFHRRKENA